mmetsp:Transcript_9160/g.12791  ORF Transcript_9160/g.12791 Transcript_9160/m.12791 type:complete len:113 (+) Transcript_9160:1231-1569(+)
MVGAYMGLNYLHSYLRGFRNLNMVSKPLQKVEATWSRIIRAIAREAVERLAVSLHPLPLTPDLFLLQGKHPPLPLYRFESGWKAFVKVELGTWSGQEGGFVRMRARAVNVCV